MDHSFWNFRIGWPQDGAGNVFLGRALNEIGEVLFPGAWTGKEAAAAHFGSAAEMKSSDDARRFHKVKATIRDALANGRLLSVLCPPDGGAFSFPQPPGHWNSENIDNRFVRCQIDPKVPFSATHTGAGHQWIFITRQSLDAFKKDQTPQEIGASAKKHLGSNRVAFKLKLIEIVLASPTKRSISRDALRKLARDEYKLPGKQAEKIRSEVLAEVSADIRAVWEGQAERR